MPPRLFVSRLFPYHHSFDLIVEEEEEEAKEAKEEAKEAKEAPTAMN